MYLVCFSQRQAAQEAQNLLSTNFCTKEEKGLIAQQLYGVKMTSPYGKELQKLLKHGVGLHHAGLLPKYRILVEKLAQKGLLKIICGTDTLGVGVNVPIRTVLFTQLCKFNGEKVTLLTARDFHQIAGRAGRRGFDTQGYVVAQAPEHVIENLRLEQKAAGDPKKQKKMVKRKPPEKGYVPWSRETFEKLISSQPEPLVSRFQVNHAMLLLVLGRSQEDGCHAFRQLIRSSHESDALKKQHFKRAFQLFRSLVERKIIELNPLRLNLDLQEDFSLNQALSLYLIDTLKLLDPQSLDYAFNVLTLVESILENPELILKKQLDRLKSEKMEELKAEGMEFEQRIEELEKLEHPKPLRDFIYGTFNDFSASHPWVGTENIHPKSIAREIVESCNSFSEYIREYDLFRIEGILLRYLSDVYKALVKTVPEPAKNDELQAITLYLGTLLKQVDSSLLEEWEKLKNPHFVPQDRAPSDAEPEVSLLADITRNKKAFQILAQNEVFRLVKALAYRRYDEWMENLNESFSLIQDQDPDSALAPPLASDIEQMMKPYYEDHERICTDSKARGKSLVSFEEDPQGNLWVIQQILSDPQGHHDWQLSVYLHVGLSRQHSRPILSFKSLGSL
ncbi:MAG: DUF3516 domain-containing protein [Bdellovibrionia bacterium]